MEILLENYLPLAEGIEDDKTKSCLEQLIKNQVGVLKEALTNTNLDIDVYDKIIFPVIRKVWPNLIANNIVAVHPMDAPTGLLRMLRTYKEEGASTAKELPPTVESTTSLPTAVANEQHGQCNTALGYRFTLSHQPVMPGTLTISFDGTAGAYYQAVVVSDAAGNLWWSKETDGDDVIPVTSGQPKISGQINWVTGEVNLVFATDPNAANAILCSYNYYAGTMTPRQVRVVLDKFPIYADTRKLKAVWEFEMEQDMASLHDMELATELTNLMSNIILGEVDYEILNDLNTAVASASVGGNVFEGGGAIDTGISFDCANPSDWYQGRKEWFETMIIEINKASSKVFDANFHAGCNFIVCSPRVGAILKSLHKFGADSGAVGSSPFAVGTQRIGTLNDTYAVYESNAQKQISEVRMLMGYKGADVSDAGYVYCPYIPMTLGPMIYSETTGQPMRFIMTRYAKKAVRVNKYYIMMTLSNTP